MAPTSLAQFLTPVSLVCAIAATVAAGQPSLAQPDLAPTHLDPWLISLNFNPPDRDAPSTTAGGASRSNCTAGKNPLTLLVPNQSRLGTMVARLGLTTDARPTFFIYIPKTIARSAEFVLVERDGVGQDAHDNEVYRTMMELPETPGTVSIKLPETVPELKVGKDYRWDFAMVCRPNDRLEDIFASAWVQRVNPDPTLTDKLRQATLRARPALYAQAGIWQDALASLAELRRTNPKDLTVTADWMSLLKAVGLDRVADEPLLKPQTLDATNPPQ